MSDKLRSDEEIAAAHVGAPEVLAGHVVLVPYDREWPRLFEREARRIRAALETQVRMLEHVGSTSVPGLSAKPRIDILLVVPDTTVERDYVPAMEMAGYVLRVREPDWFEHRLFKGPDTDVNVHVFSVGCAEIDRMLRFRDRLRTDEADRLLYERTKQELARRTWKYTQHYADAKSDVVEQILSRA